MHGDVQSSGLPDFRTFGLSYQRHQTIAVNNIGGGQVPVVIADLSKVENITPQSLQGIGYTYNEADDKWNIADAAADYVYINQPDIGFALPGTLKVIVPYEQWAKQVNSPSSGAGRGG
ncbi:hypothetical protein [Niabella ginsengisoli]|uniref:Uncharacterized protein n=1 Tax=Niabella ginsengisoli TaxID=522298 RepID=A0ABS9SEC4_9BACT|nr:hypothetical protein [Niabella ginsengisoli]MCH5596709.1 hypothetical protein [Niabella ginsengisoli]